MTSRLLLLCTAATAVFAQEPASPSREINGHRTVEGAQASARTNPIPPRFVYGAERDWAKQPFRLATVLIEFSDQKHERAHTAAFYDELLFSRGKYFKTPGGEESFGSVADWYRVQSQDRFELTGKVFDWVNADQKFEAVRQMKLGEAQVKYLKVALGKIRARDGATALDEFDGYLFVHVGPITGPPGNIFWSHRSSVAGKRYITTGEIERIGVFCHEFGHVLGLPDFYGKKGVRESFGPWCAMASGYRGKYPKSFCAWSKTRLGWCQPKVVDATTPQKLVLRPIQTNPNDAFIVPLNGVDGAGAEFLLLENRVAAGNDAEGQAGLFIWRIRTTAGASGAPVYELTLPGPDDVTNKNQATRRVAWPTATSRDFVVPPSEKARAAAIRKIRKEGDLVFFELEEG